MKTKQVSESYRRHGDVYIFDSNGSNPAGKISAAEIRKKGKRVASPVLAYGEVTGHKHELTTEAYERYELDGKTFLIVTEDGLSITHEEHGLGDIDRGVEVKEVVIDREYDYMAEMARNSID